MALLVTVNWGKYFYGIFQDLREMQNDEFEAKIIKIRSRRLLNPYYL